MPFTSENLNLMTSGKFWTNPAGLFQPRDKYKHLISCQPCFFCLMCLEFSYPYDEAIGDGLLTASIGSSNQLKHWRFQNTDKYFWISKLVSDELNTNSRNNEVSAIIRLQIVCTQTECCLFQIFVAEPYHFAEVHLSHSAQFDILLFRTSNSLFSLNLSQNP